MSGNMNYGNENRRRVKSRWQSNIHLEGGGRQDDASSQHSEDFGKDDSGRSPDVGQRLSSLFKNQMYTDVKFVVSCGVKPKPILLAHRAILAVGSQKFAEMLYGESSQEIVQSVQAEIQINNISFEAFKSVVEFLYTDDVYFENDSVVMEILSASKTFQVQPLMDKCESYFESAEISEDNVCTKLQLATAHKMESLKSRCSQFIQENTRAVIRSKDFKSSFLATVRTICKLPKFNLRSEQELFEATVAWVDSQSESHSSRRELIEPFLKHIRFLTIPCTEFTDIVSRYSDVFLPKEALSIVVYLSNPNKNAAAHNLPSWCNKGTNRCALSNFSSRAAVKGHIADQKESISLTQIRRGYLNNLICILEMKCLRGNYQVKGLKLAFGDPVTEYSSIGHLSISVIVEPSGFNITEHIRIDNSKEVVVPFTRSVLVRARNTLYIRAEASEAKNYNFLQFNEENSTFSDQSPFECSLGSVPKENRLYFISEVMYVATQPRPVVMRNFRGGKH